MKKAIQTIQKVIDNVKYKNMNITCGVSSHTDTVALKFTHSVQDATDEDNVIFVSGSINMHLLEAEDLTEERLVSLIHSQIVRMERHEVDEWFTYGGKRIYDPHAK